MKRKLIWLISNGALAVALWFALNGNIGAQRLFCFATWFFAICMVMVQCANPPSLKDLKIRGRSVPALLSHSIGAAFVIILIYQGWWFTAIGQILNELAEYSLFDNSEAK